MAKGISFMSSALPWSGYVHASAPAWQPGRAGSLEGGWERHWDRGRNRVRRGWAGRVVEGSVAGTGAGQGSAH